MATMNESLSSTLIWFNMRVVADSDFAMLEIMRWGREICSLLFYTKRTLSIHTASNT